MTDVQKAYLAAMIDGEGCFTISRSVAKGRTRHVPKILVMNTSSDLLVFLQWISGGTGSVNGRQPKNKAWKMCWCWQIASRSAMELCAVIAPWLILKREQASLMLQFRTQAHGRRGIGPEDEAIRADQARIYEEMKRLNLRGSDS